MALVLAPSHVNPVSGLMLRAPALLAPPLAPSIPGYPTLSPSHSLHRKCPLHICRAVGWAWVQDPAPNATPHPPLQCSCTHPITWLAPDPWMYTSGPIPRLQGGPPGLEGGPRRAPQGPGLTCRRRAGLGTPAHWGWTSRMPVLPRPQSSPTPAQSPQLLPGFTLLPVLSFLTISFRGRSFNFGVQQVFLTIPCKKPT